LVKTGANNRQNMAILGTYFSHVENRMINKMHLHVSHFWYKIGFMKQVFSTFDRIMQDPKRRYKFEQEHQKFVLVETLIPLLDECKISVRALADSAGISPTVIQDIKSGKKDGIAFSTFLNLIEALGYQATIRVNKRRSHLKGSRKRKNPSSS
jgi:DNA-binding Xre family transcriptional regulator